MRHVLDTLRLILDHPANEGRGVAALGRYAYWQLRKRLSRRPMDLSYHGFVLPGYFDSHAASAAYYFSGYTDYWEMKFICDYLRPGDSFLDIGANIGLYALLAASRIGSNGHVDAFEPADVPAGRLMEVVSRNQLDAVVSVHRLAAADRTGEMEFGFAVDDCESHVRRPDELGGALTAVPAVRLDDVCEGTQYAMAKLDIEGYEPFALKGASRMLAQGNPPVMQIEMAGYSKLFGVSTAAFIEQLSGRGYDCATYDPDACELKSITRPWETGLQNVLAVYRQARTDVQTRLERRASD